MANRPLPFPLQNQVSLSAITDGDASFNALPAFPDDMDEKTFVLLHISANEFRRIASSIDIGSDIGYPDDSVGVWYAWVRSVMSDTPCGIISDCIDSNDGTRNSIVNLVSSPFAVERIIEKAKELGLLPIGPTEPYDDCNDNIYGACVQYVDGINTLITNFFEVSETFRGEQIFEVLAALDLDASFAVGFISWVRDQAGAGYLASYGQVIADEIACDLFCLFKDSCAFTLSEAYDYHVGKIAEYIDLNPFGDTTVFNLLAAYIGFDDVPADVWVNGLFALFTGQMLAFEQEMTGLGAVKGTISQFQKRLSSWMNDPDPDWQILCTDCAVLPTWQADTAGVTITELSSTEIRIVNASGGAFGIFYGVDFASRLVVKINGVVDVSNSSGIDFYKFPSGSETVFPPFSGITPSTPITSVNAMYMGYNGNSTNDITWEAE